MTEHPTRVGRYRLVRCIGQGGMGRVWLARDELLERDVAIKEVLFQGGLTDSETGRLGQRTLREARAAARLDHPNVVPVYDVVTAADRPWIVMQYVASRSLHRVVTDDGPLDPPTVARIGLELVEALHAAHRNGVLHRDVTPRNVLITEDGRALLGDFGVAAIEGSAAMSQSWGITASPQYVAPERVRQGESSPATDLWALGATLYAAVEGRPPYARAGTVATLMALATEPPDAMRRAGPLTPVITGLLHRDARRRTTAEEAARLLRPIAAPTVRLRPRRSPPPADAGPDPADDRTQTLTGPDGVTQVLAGPDGVTQVLAGPGDLTQPLPGGAPTERHGLREVFAGAAFGASSGRGTGRRTAVTLAVVVLALGAVAATAAVGVRTTLGGFQDAVDGTGGGTTAGATGSPPARTTTPAATIPAAPCLLPPGAGGDGTAAPVTAAPDGPYPLPRGWLWHRDDSGFTVGLPGRWLRHLDGDVVCLRDPRLDRVLAVDLGRDPVRDPVGHWTAEARRLVAAGALPAYTRISIGPVIRSGGAAEWEYTWDGPDGERQHALRLVANRSRAGAYEVTWVASDAQWSVDTAFYRLVSASFRPTG